MAEEKEIIKIDLDAKEFESKLGKATELLETFGAGENLAPLISAFKSMVPLIGIVGGAILALKASFDLSVAAESINSINRQFEILTKNAGISTEALSEGLKKAADGLIDDTDLLEAANRSLIEMGDSAAKLPQILELARKVTSVFGGELVGNFEAINQAIAGGNVKQLKNLGIIVDQKKALDDYAKSIGVATGELTLAGRQQAILNAVLEKGNQNFSGVDDSSKKATNALHQLWNQIKDLGEAITVALGERLREPVQKTAGIFSDFVGVLKNSWVSIVGTTKQRYEQVNSEIVKYGEARKEIEEKIEHAINETQKKYYEERLKLNDMDLAGLQKKRQAYMQQLGIKETPTTETKEPSVDKTKVVDPAQAAKDRAVYEQELLKIKDLRVQNEMMTVNSVKEIDDIGRQEREIKEAEFQVKLKAIRDNESLNEQQRMTLMTEMKAQHDQTMLAEEQRIADQRQQLGDQYLKNSQSMWDGIGRAGRVQIMAAKKDLADWGGTGKQVFGAVQGAAMQGFVNMAKGSKHAGKEMLHAMLQSLGGIAIQKGSFMMLDAFDTFPAIKYPELGAGAAMVALGAKLGGGGSSVTPESAQAGAEQKYKAGGAIDTTMPTQVTQQEQTKKAVTISIQGNYFETDQTRQRLMEMVREATDATDFKYVQIGSR